MMGSHNKFVCFYFPIRLALYIIAVVFAEGKCFVDIIMFHSDPMTSLYLSCLPAVKQRFLGGVNAESTKHCLWHQYRLSTWFILVENGYVRMKGQNIRKALGTDGVSPFLFANLH